MGHDCPLAIRHRKGKCLCMLIGGVFCFGARLYLGGWAWRILFWFLMYLFFSFDVFIIYGLYMLGRDTVFYVSFYCFLFHIWYIGCWFILWGYSWYMSYFMFCEIKNLFCFTCIFHTCVYVFVECFKNIQVNLVLLLSTLVTDR